MLKADLIYNISNLPKTSHLFDNIENIKTNELHRLKSDVEFRDFTLKEYQFRKSNFEIVEFKDLPETTKEDIFLTLCKRACDCSAAANLFITEHAEEIRILTYKFLKVSTIGAASESSLNSKSKPALERFYDKYMDLYLSAEKEIKEKLAQVIENEVRRIVPTFSKCVIYFQEKNIFAGLIKDFYDNDLSSYALDKISDRTAEDCLSLVKDRNACENSISNYYKKESCN